MVEISINQYLTNITDTNKHLTDIQARLYKTDFQYWLNIG